MSRHASVRTARPEDVSALTALMRAYYTQERLAFAPATAQAALRRLLGEPQWGRVYVCEVDAAPVGYLALCLGFSLELGGIDAFIDELYIEPAWRGRGYGRELLRHATDSAKTLGATALHLEVDRHNHRAQDIYASLDFERRDRYFLMTKRLHEAPRGLSPRNNAD